MADFSRNLVLHEIGHSLASCLVGCSNATIMTDRSNEGLATTQNWENVNVTAVELLAVLFAGPLTAGENEGIDCSHDFYQIRSIGSNIAPDKKEAAVLVALKAKRLATGLGEDIIEGVRAWLEQDYQVQVTFEDDEIQFQAFEIDTVH